MPPSLEAIDYLRDFLKRRSAIIISPGKEYLVDSRLLPIAKRDGFADIDTLIAALKRNETGDLARRIIEAMTTNETSFFRDVHPWETLKTTLIPSIIKSRGPMHKLTLWCAAASTGQEPYTIAMVLREHFPELSSWSVHIVATDINASVLERAREGIYRQAEVNRGLPAPMLVKYFDRRGTDWQVKPELRKMITFQEQNLDAKWTLPKPIDLVLMRNVLIYFDVPTKRDILARTREHMGHGAYLLLGGAETTINLDDQFVPARAGNTIFYQVKTTSERRATHAAG
jgi:chemotaxis protein methyltransferase CheR